MSITIPNKRTEVTPTPMPPGWRVLACPQVDARPPGAPSSFKAIGMLDTLLHGETGFLGQWQKRSVSRTLYWEKTRNKKRITRWCSISPASPITG